MSSLALAYLRRIAFSIGCVQSRPLQGISSPSLYSPGAERSYLCSTQIQGQSPKLCFGRLSLCSPNWSFDLACCSVPCSTVYGGPIGFPIDKPSSIS